MKKKVLLTIGSGVFLAVFLSTGFVLAQNKPIWTDEIQTQLSSVDKYSYLEILQMKVEEGNVCPLFYVIQKAVSQAAGYRIDIEWKGISHFYDPRGQIVMRIMPNLYMSLSLVMLFAYFSRRYSWGTGTYALLLALSSFMVWSYWAEARPYGFWFFLTTAQILLFLEMMRQKQPPKSLWGLLMLIHWALCLTIVFGGAQVIVVSGLLWRMKEKNWRKYIWPALIPFCFSIFYYFHSPGFEYWFGTSPFHLVAESVPVEWMVLMLLWIVIHGVQSIRRKGPAVQATRPAAALTGVFFLTAVMIIGMFLIKDTHGQRGFAISSRYFIYLTPVSIIAMTLLSVQAVKAFRPNKWMLADVSILMSGLLIIRILRTITHILDKNFY